MTRCLASEFPLRSAGTEAPAGTGIAVATAISYSFLNVADRLSSLLPSGMPGNSSTLGSEIRSSRFPCAVSYRFVSFGWTAADAFVSLVPATRPTMLASRERSEERRVGKEGEMGREADEGKRTRQVTGLRRE